MKVGPGRAKPEFEDVALIASTTGAGGARSGLAGRGGVAARHGGDRRPRRERGPSRAAAHDLASGCSTTTRA